MAVVRTLTSSTTVSQEREVGDESLRIGVDQVADTGKDREPYSVSSTGQASGALRTRGDIEMGELTVRFLPANSHN